MDLFLPDTGSGRVWLYDRRDITNGWSAFAFKDIVLTMRGVSNSVDFAAIINAGLPESERIVLP